MQTRSPQYAKYSEHYWSVIKANITPAGRAHEAAFSDWYSAEHVPEWVAKDGFQWGRRLHHCDAPGQIGTSEHEYLAVYGIESVAAFNAALADGPPWGPWERHIGTYVCDWERTYYRVIDELIVDEHRGAQWAVMKVDVAPGADESGFNAWYSEIHLPEIASAPGVHRAYRLQVSPDDNDLGPRRQQYWAVYEVDAAADLVAARQARCDRGVPAWDGVWADAVTNVQLGFYDLIAEIHHDEALAHVPAEGR